VTARPRALARPTPAPPAGAHHCQRSGDDSLHSPARARAPGPRRQVSAIQPQLVEASYRGGTSRTARRGRCDDGPPGASERGRRARSERRRPRRVDRVLPTRARERDSQRPRIRLRRFVRLSSCAGGREPLRPPRGPARAAGPRQAGHSGRLPPGRHAPPALPPLAGNRSYERATRNAQRASVVPASQPGPLHEPPSGRALTIHQRGGSPITVLPGLAAFIAARGEALTTTSRPLGRLVAIK
jgi:hypothetical protein